MDEDPQGTKDQSSPGGALWKANGTKGKVRKGKERKGKGRMTNRARRGKERRDESSREEKRGLGKGEMRPETGPPQGRLLASVVLFTVRTVYIDLD